MSTSYINPALPRMIRGLYKADLREKSIQNMLDLAADLVQELIDMREQADREPSDAEVEAAGEAIWGRGWRVPKEVVRAALIAAQEVRDAN